MKTVRGINPEPLSQWLAQHLPECSAPFEWELVLAGGSNLSYVLSDSANRRWIMRRGPVSARLSKAHDMGREWRVMSALQDVGGVPVPQCIAYCADTEVNDSPFYVMELVEGRILRSADDALDMDDARCLTAMRSLVGVQAALHSVNVEEIGIADLSRTHDGYVARQLHRWYKQVQASSDNSPPKLLTEVWKILLDKDPGAQAPPSLVHGDYRFDNTVLGEDDCIKGVLDWELSTIGDPVADFYWSLLYWSKADDPVHFIPNAPTLHDGFVERDAVVAEYRARTNFDLSAGDYFMAFGYWKMACIIHGIYHRMLKGASGGMKTGSPESVWETVKQYLQAAKESTRTL